MASHLDLEEQEQLANFKHFWNQYGNLISWLVIVALLGYAGWIGWQTWQRKAGVEAAALYDELDRASQARDIAKVERVWADVQAQAGRMLQGQQAGLLAARALQEAGKTEAARAALAWVSNKTGDEALAAVARLRLAGLELDAKAPEAAIKALEAQPPAAFEGLFADRRGDALMVLGQRDAAREAYLKAHAALPEGADVRRIVEAKLSALGVDPQALLVKKESSK
jgi:predicted negative regulator of RcsB-dependent stress response